jgi:cobalt/nickel transport system permease protein
VHASPHFVHGESPVHVIAPEAKLAATFLFLVIVVVTPRESIGAFAAYAVLVLAAALVARIRPLSLVCRLRFELPFVAFALFLPFIGQEPRTSVLGLTLSVEGCWAAWNIVAKATLGVLVTSVLAATTSVVDVLRGLDRLRVPKVFTGIMGFMVRYGEVVGDEMRRMRIARLARAGDPRWFWQARAVAASAGALFIRSFERGERVHLAMLAREYQGSMPVLDASDRECRWPAFVLPATAAVVASTAWWLR